MALRKMPAGYVQAYTTALSLNLNYPDGRAIYACNRRQCAGDWYNQAHLETLLKTTRTDTAIRWLNHWNKGGSIRSIHKTEKEHAKEVKEYKEITKYQRTARLGERSLADQLAEEGMFSDRALADTFRKVEKFAENLSSTEPADHYQAEKAIYSLYKKNGLVKPKCSWANSPLQAAKICSLIKKKPLNLAQVKIGNAFHTLYERLRPRSFQFLSIGDGLWDLKRRVPRQIRREIHVTNSRHDLWWNCYFNQYQLELFIQFVDLAEVQDIMKKYQIAEFVALTNSCGWYWTFDKVCVLTERPTEFHTEQVNRELTNEYQLHNEIGPAISYRDGWSIYAWHGVTVPDYVILDPGSISLKSIQRQRNIELRRILLERYGFERFIMDSGAIPVDADRFGTLYKIEMENDEPLTLVSVMNSTLEIGGERKRYLLRVPPFVHSAKRAVAWTFDCADYEYNPQQET